MIGVLYRFVIKEKELCLYADKTLYAEDEKILSQVKDILDLFYNIVYKQEESFHVRNVVFTKLYDNGQELIEKYDLNLSASKENSDVGLSIKFDKTIREELFVYTYFLNRKEIRSFFSNLSKNINRLYDVTI